MISGTPIQYLQVCIKFCNKVIGIRHINLVVFALGLLSIPLVSVGLIYAEPVFNYEFGSLGSDDGNFDAPSGVAVDSAGNIYVADTNNNRVQKFDSSGNFILKFDKFQGKGRSFDAPSGVAVDSAGNVYVADTNNDRILTFDSSINSLFKFGKKGNTDGHFDKPHGVAVDSTGNIYVADTNNNRVQKFDSSGNFILKFGQLGSGNGNFDAPSGVAVDSAGNIYVADTNNNRVQKFDSSGNFILKFGQLGSGNDQLRSPQRVDVNIYGDIFVADTGNHRVQKFDSVGNYVSQFGSLGSGNEQFQFPTGIVMIDLAGYVADTSNNRIWSIHFSPEPIAYNQHIQGVEDTASALTLTAYDANHDVLSFSVLSPPTHGILEGSAPNLTYTPNLNYFGSDSFTFKANDGSLDSNTATIQIDVGNINDAPTTNSQSVSTNEDVPKLITVSASDVDGDALQFTIISDVQHGFLSGTLPKVTYTPNQNQFGSDSFTFKANDGLADSNLSTVSITINPINDPPVAYDVNATTDEDTSIPTNSLPYQQTDAEDDPLSLIILSPLSHGSLSGELSDLIYTPDPNYFGIDCLTFKFNDGEFDSNTAIGCAIVLPVNDPPVADAQSVATDEDVPLDIVLTGSDVEDDSLTYQIISQPSRGTLLGTAPNITYTPDHNYYGTDNFLFKVNDGIDSSVHKTISITIDAINDPPVAYNMNFTTPEDTPFVNAVIVAADDEDSPLTYILVSQPSHGTLSGIPPFMTYTPDLNYNGLDSLQFMVNDGELDSNVATLYMDIGPLDDQPATFSQSVVTDEDVPLDIVLQASNPDNDSLTYQIVHDPSRGVISGNLPNITYTPDHNHYGTDNFSFKVSDGSSDSNTSTVSITINSINDPPVVSDVSLTTQEDTPYHGVNEYLEISSDAENDPLTFVLLSPPSHGIFSGVLGNFTYTPVSNYFGSDCILFKANDGDLDSNVATACITIRSVNDPPVADDQQITMVPDHLESITLTAFDIENDTLSYQIISQPAHGTLFGNAPNVKYLPDKNYVGNDKFTFKANDGNTTSIFATISLTIIEQPQQPQQQGGSDSRTLPKFTGLEFIDSDKSDYMLYQLDDKHEILPQKTLQMGQDLKIRVRVDDKEATSNVLHFGIYMDIRDRTSQISKSQAYLIYEKGKNNSIIDSKGLFESATINPVFEGNSMWMEVDLIFKKPMDVSDIILEAWNEGRHPIYFTIPNSLEIKSNASYDSKEDVDVQEQSVQTHTENNQTALESNISGTVVITDTPSEEPITIHSTAMGKKTQIKNNQDYKIENQDLRVEISGYYPEGNRGQHIILTILHPDESTHVINAYLNSKNHYSVPAKLYDKWQSGIYQIVAKVQTGINGNDSKIFGKIQFFVNDVKYGGFAVNSYAQYVGNEDSPDVLDERIGAVLTRYITWPSPIKQIKLFGFEPENIKCNSGLELILRINEFPACVAPKSIPKLIERGWAMANYQNTISDNQLKSGSQRWGIGENLQEGDFRFNISGNVQETSESKVIHTIIILPDKSIQKISSNTNGDGYYSLPAKLDKKWQNGDYTIISKYHGDEIGRVSFTLLIKNS